MLRRSKLLVVILLIATFSGTVIPFLSLRVSDVQANGSWLLGWDYRRLVTIDSTLVDEDLTDLPVLVKLESTNHNFSKSQDHGEDIRFTSADGSTLLKHEIERWDGVGGRAEIWVKLPNVLSSSDTHFYIYYGNTSVLDGQDPANVWDSGYVMVHHMKDETPSTVEDSTLNSYDGTKKAAGEPVEVAGQIYSGQDFDGGDDYVQCGDVDEVDSATELTFSVWANITGNGPLISKYTDANYRTHIYNSGSDIYWNLSNDTASYGVSPSLSGWNYYVMVFNGSETGKVLRLKGYVNGEQQTLTFTGTIPAVAADTGTNQLEFGRQSTAYFDGQLDEIRVSNTARSAAWIKAQYLNMKDEFIFCEGCDVAVTDPPTTSPPGKKLLGLSLPRFPPLTANISVNVKSSEEFFIQQNVVVTVCLVDENETETPALCCTCCRNLHPGEDRLNIFSVDCWEYGGTPII